MLPFQLLMIGNDKNQLYLGPFYFAGFSTNTSKKTKRTHFPTRLQIYSLFLLIVGRTTDSPVKSYMDIPFFQLYQNKHAAYSITQKSFPIITARTGLRSQLSLPLF
jgi:hypothetical protein